MFIDFFTLNVLSIRSLYYADRWSVLHFMWKCLNRERKVTRNCPKITNTGFSLWQCAVLCCCYWRSFWQKKTLQYCLNPPAVCTCYHQTSFCFSGSKPAWDNLGAVNNVQAAMTGVPNKTCWSLVSLATAIHHPIWHHLIFTSCGWPCCFAIPTPPLGNCYNTAMIKYCHLFPPLNTAIFSVWNLNSDSL